MVVIIIEEARAVDDIEAIASTPGVDVLFIGTSDLSFSLGLRGDQQHPKHREAVARILEAAQRHQKVAGRPAGSPDQVREFLKQGFRFFQCTTDLGFMASGMRRFLEPLGKFTPRPEIKTLY